MILCESQLEAINKIKDFITNSDNIAFSLEGAAGTGKTTCLIEILNWLDSKVSYALTAPTHKAALVLKQITTRDANTLHSLLALSPNIQILDLDLRELQFVSSKVVNNIPYNGVVICDEASMISNALYDLLIEKVSQRNSKIIFVSDSAQLLPVKQNFYSKVYQLSDSYKLTKIYRQSEKNAIGPILQKLRSQEVRNLKNISGEDGSLIVRNDLKEFLKLYIPQVQEVINTKNILYSKLLAYTNKRVSLYNQAIRKMLDYKEEYHNGEILTAYENGEYEGNKFFNSMDYIIVGIPEKVTSTLPEFGDVLGWNITLWDEYFKDTFNVFILSQDNPDSLFSKLAYTIEHLRLKAIEAKSFKSRAASLYWRSYYNLINSFSSPIDLYYDNRVVRKKSFDYGYAMTVHKSQGSTYNNIFIDWRNLKMCNDSLVRRQLQYVAMSRTRKDAYVLV